MHRNVITSVILLVGASFAAWVFFATRQLELSREQEAVYQVEVGHAVAIERRVVANLSIMQAVAGLFEASSHVTETEFQTFTRRFMETHGGLDGVAWIPSSVSDNFDGAESFKGKAVYFAASSHRSGPGSGAGYDPMNGLTAQDWVAALGRARDTGKIQTLPCSLTSDVPCTIAVITPVYASGEQPETEPARRKLYRGVVIGLLCLDEIMNDAVGQESRASTGLDALMYREAPSGVPELLYSTAGLKGGRDRSPERAASAAPALSISHRFRFAEENWSLIVRPSRDALGNILVWQAWVGAYLVLLFIVAVAIGYRRTTAQALARQRSEEQAQENEARLARATRVAHLGAVEIDVKTGVMVGSDELYQLLGANRGQIDLTSQYLDFVHPDDRAAFAETFMGRGDGGDVSYLEYRIVTTAGDVRFVRGEGHVERYDSGRPRKIIGFVQDITGQKQAEMDLIESQRQLSSLLANIPGMTYRLLADKTWTMSFISKGVFDLLGYEPEDLIGESRLSYSDLIRREDRDTVREQVRAAIEKHQPYEMAYRVTTQSNIVKWVWERGRAHYGADGNLLALEGLVVDITGRVATENALSKSQERLAKTQEIAGIATLEIDLVNEKSFYSKELLRIFGLDPENDTLEMDQYYDYIHPEDRPGIVAQVERIVETQDPIHAEYRVIAKTGEEKHVLGFLDVEVDSEGNTCGLSGTVQDVTSFKQTERQLQQAQKMETVGHLSAGVAHDFNNLLAVVMGNLELVKDQLGPDSPSVRLIDKALAAGGRGADLTRRLLAFSRQQALFPHRTDVNELIQNLLSLMDRTIGSMIAIRFEPDPALWPVSVDSAQLESALLNLAVNSRDAMPGGGTLTVTAKNVTFDPSTLTRDNGGTPGEYVLVEVSDTGEGMGEETVKRAVEPFFTTKEVGEGSGLGLSMVYGFLRQSDGYFDIESEVGHGTRIKLYFPRDISDESAPEKQAQSAGVARKGNGQTILVVEDDSEVRNVVVQQIEGLGYTVISVSGAQDALGALEHRPEIDLMFTDVMLGPGMNGVELAVEAQRRADGLKVLCTSGYAENTVFELHDNSREIELIAKPFTREDLSARLQTLLAKDAA